MRTTQKNKIINLLDDGGWHCTSEFYAMFIADPRTIMAKLKKEGLVLSRWCKKHPHAGSQKEWQLVGGSAQPVVPLYKPLPRDTYSTT